MCSPMRWPLAEPRPTRIWSGVDTARRQWLPLRRRFVGLRVGRKRCPLREVGAFEAKNKLDQLLDLVQQAKRSPSPATGRRWRGWCRCGRSAAGRKPAPRFGAFASAPNSVSSVASTGPSGNPTGMKGARESGARQFGDACVGSTATRPRSRSVACLTWWPMRALL
jgi:hypothetical protein